MDLSNYTRKNAYDIGNYFGAHLMPYSWLYKSRVYFILSILIPFFALIIGLNFEPAILSLTMMGIEIIFSIALVWENREITD